MATLPFDHPASDHLVPPVVAEKISDVVNRTRSTRLFSAAVVALAAILIVMLVAIGVDWALVLFEPGQRTRLTVASLVMMGILTAICLGMAAIRRFSKLDAARQIDEHLPQLQERWTSITEFSSTRAAPEIRGSETLIRKVAEEAEEFEKIVRPEQIRMGKELTFALWGLGAVLGIWIVAIMIDSSQMTILVRRFLNPQSAISLTQVRAESGDVVQPRGSNLKLTAIVSGRVPQSAQIAIRSEAGAEEIVRLESLSGQPSQFVFPIKDLQNSFAYRFRSGDGQTKWHKVLIADRPVLKRIDFQIIPPAYSKLPDFHQDGLPKSIKALQGSRLVVQFEPNMALKSLVIQQENNVNCLLESSDSKTYRWEMELTESIVFRPILESHEGLANVQPPRCEIVVFRDQAPVVEVASPTNEVAVRPDDIVTIFFEAKDDLGISKAELVIFDASKGGAEELKTISIPLGKQTGEKSIHAQTELDLNDFDLKHGEQLAYAIRVYDTKDESTTEQPGSGPQSKSGQPQTTDDPKSNPTLAQSASEAASPAENDSADRKSNSDEKSKGSQQENHLKESDKDQLAKKGQESDPPKQQAGGGNRWKPKSTGDQKPNDQPKGEVLGKPRPDFEMAKHELDTPAGQCSSCSRRRITIDEWAGSFASQFLDKLQLQIDPVLKELKKTLTHARETLQTVAERKTTARDWKSADSIIVRKGDGFLDSSEQQVRVLTGKAEGTSYAFIGLQLQDISQLHIHPAREHLSDVTLFDKPATVDDLTASVVHIQRAIDLLEKLTREYEAVKLNQKLAETMIRIKKMHQMFLEGTFALLTSQKPNLNPKERAFMELELSDEFLARLQVLLKKKLEIQAELAKVLSQDPRLLERFMARSRLEATTLRDQLTLLHSRQRTLLADVKEGLPAANEQNGKLELKSRLLKRVELADRISEEASQMLDNYVVWTPLNFDISKGEMARFKAKGVKLVATATELAKQARSQEADKAIELGRTLYDQVVDWGQTLPDLLDGNVDPKMQIHVANRVQEAEKLITEISGFVIKEQSMEAGDQHLAAEVDQHRITVDTMVLTRKLSSLNAQCQGISPELAKLASSFLKILEFDLIPELEASQVNLNANRLPEAVEHQAASIEQFARAEEQLDEVMDGIIRHLDSLPFNEKPELSDDVKPESLEELLAMLDQEARAAEALGIPCCRPSNLVIEKDWFKPGSNPGAGRGSGGQSVSGRRSLQPGAQMRQAQMANQKVEEARKQLEDALRKMTKGKKLNGQTNKNGLVDQTERKWDTLGSKLEENLRQGRGNLPPEQYRKAIELYFEKLAGSRR